MATRTFRVFRGDRSGGELHQYEVNVDEGMVVLDVIHRIQATEAPDLAVRWNCKAGKCGSCSCEINGKPRLACMTRMDTFEPDAVITVQPVKTFPLIKDLVTDVSWNYRQKKRIPPFRPRPRDPDGNYRMMGGRRPHSGFRKCIECYLCQDVCHVLRDQNKGRVRRAALHDLPGQPGDAPLDTADRTPPFARTSDRATATSPSAAPTSARSTSTSPTTASSRSRNASSIASMIRSPGSWAAAARRPRPRR
jgi:succinate dehydrogenase / fumarate reductase iron-sulfur subunit